MAHASVKLAWVSAHLGELEAARQYNFACLHRMGDAVHDSLDLMVLLSEACCLAAEGQLDSAVALAAFVAENPVTWKETADLARPLLASLAENLETQSFQVAHDRFSGRGIHELTSAWFNDHPASGAAS
jgi:hypothetical protein